MGKITLEGLEFFAYHGFHAEEQIIGNKYAVDILVEADVSEAAYSDRLSKTIDYGKLYKAIETEMQQPSKLLEHIAYRISRSLLEKFEIIMAVEVSVSKYNPPIGGICQRAKITIRETKDS
jgi:7,8-dihydroneopterin aldolase/epimerase/oxygenase